MTRTLLPEGWVMLLTYCTNEDIFYQSIVILFLDTSFLSSGIIVASQSFHRHCLWQQEERQLPKEANVVALCVQNIKLPTPVFALGTSAAGCQAKAIQNMPSSF
jgi:hypothetical protein